MSTKEITTTNVIIKDVEIYWAKLAAPVVNQFSDELQYEIQIRVPASRRTELEVMSLNPKNPTKEGVVDETVVSVNLKKKAKRFDGTDAEPVRVVDGKKEAIDASIIGNGSRGNVLLMQRPYEIKNPKTGKVTKTGITTQVVAVQVTDLVEFRAKASRKLTDMFDEETVAVSKPASDDDF